MTVVIRLVVDDGWTEVGAARRLRDMVPNDPVLRRARARVARALAQRASPFGERAAATLDAALALSPPPAPAVVDLPASRR